MKNICFTFMILFCTSFVYASTNDNLVPKPIDNFNINKYLGLWYEIGKIENSYEKNCNVPITSEWIILNDSNIGITYSCISSKGEKIISKATGYLVNDNIGQIEISFLPKWLKILHFLNLDMLILYTDYKYALEGTKNKKMLWILARSEKIDKSQIKKMLLIAQKQGYDTNKVKFNY